MKIVFKYSYIFTTTWLFILILWPNSIDLNTQNQLFACYILVCSLFSAILTLKNIHHIYDITDLIVGFFFLYLLIHSLYLKCTETTSLHLGLIFCLYFGLRIMFHFSNNSWLLALLFIANIIQATIGLLQLLGIIPSNHTLYLVTGTFFNPGPYGGFLAATASLAFPFIIDNYNTFFTKETKVSLQHINIYTKQVYYLAVSAFSLTILTLPFTLSRGAFIALLLPSIYYLFKRNSKYLHRLSIYKILIIAITALALCFFLYSLYKLKPQSANGRLYIWNISWNIIKMNPLLGNGLDSFPQTFSLMQEQYLQSMINTSYKHADYINYAFNEYIHAICEIGICGFLFLGIIIFTITRIYKEMENIFLYGLISLLCFAFFSYPFHIIPFQILLTIFLTQKRSNQYSKQLHSLNILPSVFFIGIYIHSIITLPKYIEKVEITKKWINQKEKTEFAGVDFRKSNELKKYYPSIHDNPRFLWDYGVFLFKKHNYQNSINILQQGIKYSGDPGFYVYIGMNYEYLGNYCKAEEYYYKAFAILPNRIYPLYKLCMLFDKLQNKHKLLEIAMKIHSFKAKVNSNNTLIIKNEINRILESNNIRTKINKSDHPRESR